MRSRESHVAIRLARLGIFSEIEVLSNFEQERGHENENEKPSWATPWSRRLTRELCDKGIFLGC